MRATCLAFPLLLAACSGPIETRIDSAGMASVEPMSFAIDTDLIGPAAGAQAVVTKLLTEKGFRSAEVAELDLTVTVSDRPANLALLEGRQTIAPAAGKRPCAKRDYRLGVVLTKISDGSIYYRGHAAEYHCKLALDDVLGKLVEAAMADLGNPRGSYSVKRRR